MFATQEETLQQNRMSMRNLTVDDLIGEKDYPKLSQHLSDGDCMLALSLSADVNEAIIDYSSTLNCYGYQDFLNLIDQVDEGTNIGWLIKRIALHDSIEGMLTTQQDSEINRYLAQEIIDHADSFPFRFVKER